MSSHKTSPAYYVKWYFLYNGILFSSSFFLLGIFFLLFRSSLCACRVNVVFFLLHNQYWGYTHFLCGCIFKEAVGILKDSYIFFDGTEWGILIYCLDTIMRCVWNDVGTWSGQWMDITTTICGPIFWECKLNREFAHEASTQQLKKDDDEIKQREKTKRLDQFIIYVVTFAFNI